MLFLKILRIGLPVLAAAAGLEAANLCVSPGGAGGCYPTIGAAVSAASPYQTIQINPGTYHEQVTILKPVELIGAPGAIIDATGLDRGVLINGLASKAARDVLISGLTVQNANFEGILALDASYVTVASNQVLNNNRALTPSGCPGLPAYETNEQMDCGEGVHLLGADHAIVSANTIEGNSGGILMSDDTGATHDNIIVQNTVRDNPYACGITMASHPAAGLTGSKVPLGVYHNTVYANHATHNGFANGGGAGVGMFGGAPGGMAFGNVVVNNLVDDNGIPGIALHAHIPGQNLNDNVILGNTALNNAADSGDSATPGPTGINIYGAGPVTGTMIVANNVNGEQIDVAIHTPAEAHVELNSLLGTGAGVANLGKGSINATANWWGCPTGPGTSGCSSVAGVSVLWTPWLPAPIPAVTIY